MKALARALFPLIAAALVACGTTPQPGPSACAATCDCKAAAATQSCPGEWVCGLKSTCEYACKGTCALGGVYTCRDTEECNGTICSERTACK
jgi:hypothetical protein